MARLHLLLLVALLVVLETPPATRADDAATGFRIHPIGHVEKSGEHTRLVVDEKYQAGLRGLDGFSHICAFWWFDRNDNPQKRAILQVHPMGNRDNPLTGVFATRSPVRPNLVALTLCEIVSVKANVVEVSKIDAFDGTPLIDIKPFIPGYDTADEAKLPDWLQRSRKKRADGQATAGHADLHNVMRVSERIYSGGEPHGEEAFESLASKGVKTVVSVDGAHPDIQSARKHGLRYVHIPIGYDGIPDRAGAALARLVREVDGPFYIHCHHGRHRGPAAAAVACIASGAIRAQDALKILEKAGTSKNYQGLWRDVEKYQPPAPGAALPELVETAKVDSLAAAMAKIDRAYDSLELCRDAKWSAPENHPDLVPALQAFVVREGLQESEQHSSKGFDQRFARWLIEAEKAADSLGQSVLGGDPSRADRHFATLTKLCHKCHADYRD